MKIEFLPKHKAVFRKLGVDVVYLFGSYAGGNIQPMSDVDIGVVFREPEKYKKKSLDAYSALYDVFIEVLPRSYLKKRVQLRVHEFDLVFLQFSPLDLQFNALKSGHVIYQSDPRREADYRHQALKKYLDLSHHLKMKERAVLERI